jgi:F-type H+-transporting ATPase subunit a
VWVANWWEFIPGFDSIGWLESHTAPNVENPTDEDVLTHYETRQLLPGIKTIVNEPYTPTYEEYHEAHEEHVLPTNEEGEEVAVLVPFLRAAATDLNFTLALALSTVVMIQILGIQALGLGYFSKFINLKGGAMGFVVGLFEIISEVSRIISFAFRLFGNIFGGAVLLFVLSFLVPWVIPMPFYVLELFVGVIQAFVFALLTLVFFSGAVVSHDEHH